MVLSFSAAHAQLVKTDSLEFKYPTDIVVTAPRMSLALKEAPFSMSSIEQATLRKLYRSTALNEPMKLVPLPAGLGVGFGTEKLSKAYIDGANVKSEAVAGYTLIHARVTCGLQVAGLRGDIVLNGRNLMNVNCVAFSGPDHEGNA
jgi:hypothetical protein